MQVVIENSKPAAYGYFGTKFYNFGPYQYVVTIPDKFLVKTDEIVIVSKLGTMDLTTVTFPSGIQPTFGSWESFGGFRFFEDKFYFAGLVS